MNFLLGTSYAGNLNYFSCIKNSKNIAVDLNEFFHKQSFKNRCQIYGANGLLNLTVPIQRKAGRNPVKDIKIEYSFNWQKVHWKSLESSYRSSPYFEYYEHYFASLYLNEKPKFLIDFNTSVFETVLKILDLNIQLAYTDSYEKSMDNFTDNRNLIHPKLKPTPIFSGKKYYQVFQEKFGFIPNLSIYDLIYNEGPSAVLYL